MKRICGESEGNKNDNGGQPEIKRRHVQNDCHNNMCGNKKSGGHDHIQRDQGGGIADRILCSLQPRACSIQIASEFIQLCNDVLNFEKHGANDAQISRTMLASKGFILDGFGAERTFHQTDLCFVLRLSRSSSALVLDNSSRAVSRLRRRSSRSAIRDGGIAISRAQEPQTSAFEGFSRVQNGQIADIESGCHLQNKARAADTPIRVLDINSDHVIADRQFDVWYINAGWLHE